VDLDNSSISSRYSDRIHLTCEYNKKESERDRGKEGKKKKVPPDLQPIPQPHSAPPAGAPLENRSLYLFSHPFSPPGRWRQFISTSLITLPKPTTPLISLFQQTKVARARVHSVEFVLRAQERGAFRPTVQKCPRQH